MKKAKSFKRVAIGMAMLMTTSAFAANKGSLELTSRVTVGGTQLAAGDYTVQWEGSGPGVEMKIKKDNKIMVIIPAKLMPVDHPFDNNAAVVGVHDGARNLTEIRFAGKKFELQIPDEAVSVESMNSNANQR
jgi:hypothetical protein